MLKYGKFPYGLVTHITSTYTSQWKILEIWKISLIALKKNH